MTMARSRWRYLVALSGWAVALVAGALPAPAAAQGALTVYCSVQLEWCQAVANEFTRQTNVRVAVTQKGSGEVLRPGEGGGGEPEGRHLVRRHRRSASAGRRGRADPGVQVAQPEPAASVGACARPSSRATGRWASTRARSASATTPSSSRRRGWRRRAAGPTCSSRRYKGEIQMANPNSSGTAYTMVATLVQLMGEDKAFEYLAKLHTNINQYTKSGRRPDQGGGARRDHGRHQLHPRRRHARRWRGSRWAASTPCEGTGVRDRLESASSRGRATSTPRRASYDWALTAPAQRSAPQPSSSRCRPTRQRRDSDGGAEAADIKLIDYDFEKYGASAERGACSTSGRRRSTRCRGEAVVRSAARHRLRPSAAAAPCCCPGTPCRMLPDGTGVDRRLARRAAPVPRLVQDRRGRARLWLRALRCPLHRAPARWSPCGCARVAAPGLLLAPRASPSGRRLVLACRARSSAGSPALGCRRRVR